MASASGGNERPLQIEILNVRDGSTRRCFEFPERRDMASNSAVREGYGREWDLSPNGRFMALSRHWIENGESNDVEIWDTTSGELVHRIEEVHAVSSAG